MTDDLIDQLRDPQTTQVAGRWLKALVLQAADRIEGLEAKLRYSETLKRQLDAVDRVLAWHGTGHGRVSSVEALHTRIEELEAENERLRGRAWDLLDAMHDGDSRPGALGSAVLHLRMALNAEDDAS